MRTAFLSILAFLLLSSGRAYAIETAVPAISGMEYTVILKKIEIFNEKTGLWVTACETASSFDVGSAQTGAEIANLITGLAMPDGSYSKIRVTIDNRFRIKAFVMVGKEGRCTAGSVAIGKNTLASAVGCTSIAGASPVTVILDFLSTTLGDGEEAVGSDLRTTHDIPPFTMGPGSGQKTVEISFHLNNTLKHFSANHFGPGSPEAITPGQPDLTETMK